MCGICGIFNYTNQDFKITEDLLSAMCQTMAHRGPDDQGVYVDRAKGIGLGHRRLSIIDLSSAGHQPMCNEDQSVWVTFNGEIYNHNKIRPSLEQAGHRYTSHTDTETILHLYEEKGVDCVQSFEGMFAIGIWDKRYDRLFLVRDRIGIKPLYYTIQNGMLIFASEIKAILACPFIKRELDETALFQYLTFTSVPPPLTMFKGIYKLAAGHYLTCARSGNIKVEQYWDAIVPKKDQPQDEGYYIEQVRDLFSQAVEKRMMSDVPFGVFLSGGVDSSLNVAFMSRIMNRPVDTFTIGFDNVHGRQEFQNAREIAQLFKTNHHERLISNKDLMDFLPLLIHHQDEPIADPMCVALHFVAKLAKDNNTIVVQVGEGSDELFFGYEGFAEILRVYNQFWRKFTPLPGFIKNLAFQAAKPWLDIDRLDIINRARQNKELFYGGVYVFGELEKAKLLRPEHFIKAQKIDPYDVVKKYFDKLKQQKPDADFMEKMIYMELKIRLPELLLMRVDKMSMISSIEARVPFLDHKMVEFAMNIPAGLKLKNGTGKYILKKAAEGFLPNETVYRRKMGFGGPYKDMLSPEFLQHAEDLLAASPFIQHYFQVEYIHEIFRQHRQTKAENSLRIWNLYNLLSWYTHWIGD